MGIRDILKISFEFSPKLGVRDLPELSRDHESTVSGLYVAGDLADAPIIKAALRQGFDVGCTVVRDLGDPGAGPEGVLDVIVIGAGPAGIGASLALADAGARHLILERERPFNTIQNFPRAKLIFSEPREVQSPGGFWFEDATKEELVARWEEALAARALPIQQPEEVTGIRKEGGIFVVETRVGEAGLETVVSREASGEPGATNRYRARRVILAIGRRGAIRRLGVPGEELDKVAYALRDPADHAGERVLVVGGGDSAVEAAIATAEAGAEVTISYRRDSFARARAKNRARIDALIAAGTVRAELGTVPEEIRPESVRLRRGDEIVEIPNDRVLVFVGATLPTGFLRRIGVRMSGEMTLRRAAWVLSFAAITYLFYVLKHEKPFWPFGPGNILGFLPDALKVDLGFRRVAGPFWGTCAYALIVLGFGLAARRRYPSPVQKRRYLSLMIYQGLFLFGIPEIIAPLIIDRPWKIYAVTVPWPLSTWSLIDAPGWAGGSVAIAAGWIAAGAAVAFVAVPLYVRSQGERFCSYLCGCGGLAETLGDRWRHLAPRGRTAYQAEWAGRIIFLVAIPVTLMVLADAWRFVTSGAFTNAATFARHWYGLMVDFWLASVVGVAFYPYLGNRVWCRFFCPLRAYMEILARRFARIGIVANDRCIGCGECTRYCQMGIEVQAFAQRRAPLDNASSSCIQCGICIQVCPMDVLSIAPRAFAGAGPRPLLRPAAGPPPVARSPEAGGSPGA